MKTGFFLAGVLILANTAVAQTSPSFQLTEHVFNAGGHPAGGVVLRSPSHEISLDSIGSSLTAGTPSSPSFVIDATFVWSYRPPVEVTGLVFTDEQTIAWGPERSAGTYGLYRGLVSSLAALGFGSCEVTGMTQRTVEVLPGLPPDGDAYCYLVTAENLLHEEGIKGFQSTGAPRPNAVPCP